MYRGNVLFVQVPGVKLKISGVNLGAVRTNHPKISQLILAAIAKRDFPNSSVRIADLKSKNPNKETKYKKIQYGKDLIDAYLAGETFDSIESDIRWADTIVLTNNFTQEAGIVGDLIGFCKQANPAVRVFVGGSDAMVARPEVNRQNYFVSKGADCVAAGDGEILLPRVLEGTFSSKESIAVLPDFDKVPNPALDMVDLSQYTESHEGPLPSGVLPPLMYMKTSRGCRQFCDFCSTPFTKGRYRFMSQKRIESLLMHYASFGVRTLLLCEDNVLSRLDFSGGRELIIQWFNFMREHGFVWEFSNGVEIGKLWKNNVIDAELIGVLFGYDGKTGCYRSYIPLERVDAQSYRKLKSFEVEKEILECIARSGVQLLNLGVIVGNPRETSDSLALTETKMHELMGLCRAYSVSPYVNVFLHIPIPGTIDYRRFYDEHRLAYDVNCFPELYNFYTSVINGDNFDCRQLTRIRREIAFRLNGEHAMKVWEHTGRYEY